MSEFRSALRDYDLERALVVDCGSDCVVVNVGRDEHGQQVASLAHVIEQVEHITHHTRDAAFTATKFYVIGEWTLTPDSTERKVDNDSEEPQGRLDGVAKWQQATAKICELLQQMSSLKELTWVSGLPFTASVWAKLPTTLVKLVLDLGGPVRLEQDGNLLHKSYITSDEVRPLLEQTKLEELRLLNVHNSFQPLLWETVFRNTSECGMRILDIKMAAAPIVRFEQWKRAKDVAGLTVALEEAEDKVYKGKDGKGCLHYKVGTGEYLDDYCIRKARIASGLDEATPLPLRCLKLDGFVIDHLPFAHELSGIVLLTCGENCIDSGLRAPKIRHPPQNKWSMAVNDATSHCLIKWPNWTGIFDDQGDQRNKLGLVISQDTILSTPISEFSPSSPAMPLTKEALHMKEVREALADVKKADCFNHMPLLGEPAIGEARLSIVSSKSERGSQVPTPTAPHSPRVLAEDGPALELTTSFGSSDMTIVSPTSTFSGFEQVDAPADISTVTTASPHIEAAEESSAPKKSTFSHKVRQSIGWLTGSYSS
ncbi:hypothetical protein ACEQ8H_002583 [Pleosporales sp. CAS-2024a]